MSNSTDDQSSQASSVDDGATKTAEDHQAKVNGLGQGEPRQNGVSEKHSSSSSKKHSGDGHHKSSSSSSSSDKHKSSSSSSKHGSSSSSSSKHRDGSSSSSSKHRDPSSSSSSSKHRDGSSKHSSSSSSSKSKDGHRSSSSSSHRDKDGKTTSSSSSSSHKHKDGQSSSSSSNKHSSSSSSKHKDGSSHSSSSKHREDGKDKHRDKGKESSSSSSKDRDKHKSSSSSSGDKHKSSSSSSDKHKSSSSSSGDKHKSSSGGGSSTSDQTKVKVKEEVELNDSSNHFEAVKEVKKELTPSSPVKKEHHSPVKKEPAPAVKSEEEEESEDEDKPLSIRINESRPQKRVKEESDYEDEEEQGDDDDDDDDEDVPLLARAKQAKKQKLDKKPPPPPKVEPKKETKAIKKEKASAAAKRKQEPVAETTTSVSPTKRKKKEEEEQEVWRWWEEQAEDSGKKWTFLEHKGPVFAVPYESVPKNVRFYYESKPMELTEATEEVATFYGRMLDHDYTTKDVFNTNFFKDWRKVMSDEEKKKITDLKKCNFTEYNDYFKKKSEERKAMSKEAKQKIKKENEEMMKEYGFCMIDKHKEKIGNFKIEPPSLFRGRGDHPKQGMLKRRVMPEDVIINCSKDSKVPKPPDGRKWKEVRHDNTVTWLASWTENIQGATKYVMLNAASKLKGQKDWQKYELARKLHKCVDKIRANYQEDWKSKEMRVRQRAVALYFIDKLALRAGNEKDGEESADTVGCCSLRVEHTTLHEEKAGKPYVVEFDFLGKDSIRYQNSIPVEKRVFKNLQLFMENKQPEDDLFDRLNTVILNKHLQDLMDGLTAKVFRTYNASRTLSEQLELLTNGDDQPAAKMLSYNRANRAVAILCNHQRAVPKTFEKTMENLQKKIDSKNEDIKSVKKEIKGIKADYKQQKSVKTKTLYEKKKKTLARLEEQLTKLEVDATDKDENKEIALGTSKLNYLDPRISVAWCKKFEVPIEKVYNKTQRDKFRWAIDMATEHFKF